MTWKTLWSKLNSPVLQASPEQQNKVGSKLFGMTAGLAVVLFIVFVVVPFGLLVLIFGWLHLAGF